MSAIRHIKWQNMEQNYLTYQAVPNVSHGGLLSDLRVLLVRVLLVIIILEILILIPFCLNRLFCLLHHHVNHQN